MLTGFGGVLFLDSRAKVDAAVGNRPDRPDQFLEGLVFEQVAAGARFDHLVHKLQVRVHGKGQKPDPGCIRNYPAGGIGAATVRYRAKENPWPGTRTGYLTIAGNTYTGASYGIALVDMDDPEIEQLARSVQGHAGRRTPLTAHAITQRTPPRSISATHSLQWVQPER